MFNTPILFIIYKRLDTAKQVFSAIRQIKPARLFVAADGPKHSALEAGGGEEAEKCRAVRRYIMDNIDWDCEVKTLFRDENLGCGRSVSGAVTWFFEQVEQGIILEDDCVPSISFFLYCEELLEYYKNDQRVFNITGYNKQGLWNPEKYDYFFSYFGGIWGWASWRRAWKYYDFQMSDIDNFITDNNFVNLLGEGIGELRQKTIYEEIKIKKIDAWAYQWGYVRHKNNGLSCVPAKNLINNIGFGEDATHTKFAAHIPPVHSMNFPLKKNKFFVPDRLYDAKFIDYSEQPPFNKTILYRIYKRIIRKIRRMLNSISENWMYGNVFSGIYQSDAEEFMKQISIMDTSISDSNLGNQIIMEAVYQQIENIFRWQYIYRIPYMEITEHTMRIIKNSDMCFFGGTNCLCAELENYSQCGIDKHNYKKINNLILCGCGWWQYQSWVSKFSQKILKSVLGNRYIHAVRDNYTEMKLRAIGIINVVNTGCPTIWDLSDYRIGTPRAKAVVFTITDYNKNPERDRKWLEFLKNRYDVFYFWPQGTGDIEYIQNNRVIENIRIIRPSLADYTELLNNTNIDYVGTRLHAGIRALQYKKKAFIIGIDNRAIEMQKDFNIPVILESDINGFDRLVQYDLYQTQFKIPRKGIELWKTQFSESPPPPHDIILPFIWPFAVSYAVSGNGQRRQAA
jgi:hypothetical protein